MEKDKDNLDHKPHLMTQFPSGKEQESRGEHMQEGDGGLREVDAPWYAFWRSEKKPLGHPIKIAEAEALIEYAARKGIHKDEIPAKLNTAIEKYRIARKDNEDDPKTESESEIVTLYAQLCELTGQVSGKMLVDSRKFHKITRGLKAWTVSLTMAALMLAGMDLMIVDIDPPDPMSYYSIWAIHTYFLNIFEPFVWGGLGACVYLIKLVGDLKSAIKFDEDQYPGWQSRLLLGAVLGGGFAYLFEPSQFIEGDFGANAIAFVAGVMVKIIYGTLEKFAEAISKKFDMGNVHASNRQVDAINEFLAEELSKTNKDDNPQMYEAIVELLNRRV